MAQYVYLTVLFPFIGFLINGLVGRKIKNEKVIGTIGSLSVFLSFLIFLSIFIEMLSLPEENRKFIVDIYNWITISNFNISVSYNVDPLSVLMSLVVTGVGFLIHVYSIGYMHGDKGFWRFFAYLNLFIFMMLNLVLANNMVLMFLGWEGVGLCSYLLIGFWYDRKFENSTVASASKKAFIVNRIGDFGFLIGIFTIYLFFNTLNINEIILKAQVIQLPTFVFTFIGLFLLLGATGKSAQIPLYVWLPDAMAGPTPVSALIHAATMVTAGVYMIARLSIIFVQSPVAMASVAIVGAFTAIFAASIGLVQNDIKKVLAYSTISQLGYMFLALGVGAFASGIFHVMTHAFFKALLFLGAGSVIHAMHEEQNIKHYGGLKKYLPVTYKTFLIATLAIAGIPGLSGFFSKDEILWYTYNHSFLLWLIGIITAFMTAFYMTRLLSLTFYGSERFDKQHHHPHESPKVMTIPLIILAVLSVIGGYVGLPHVIAGEKGNLIEHWLDPVFKASVIRFGNEIYASHFEEVVLILLSSGIAVAGIYFAYKLYIIDSQKLVKEFKHKYNKFYLLLVDKYRVDELYEKLFVKSTYEISDKVLYKFTDAKVIDGAINGTAKLVNYVAERFRKIQTGEAQIYALVMLIGIILSLFFILIKF
ncbi:MAG TPA: NADH-quinone oxidoreductase subunit L [Ignavibacteriales bacterium]|nr:NADH-quinone oxidoreductase subunit L [Ignavibacteriales bacterium]HOL80769.1 NADH-quinone oxidoreductase subunit L [Ignavibacteriales bacterium]HOM66015.1 NADH-quinone oxidoreductase subunit L [Ignavibacteriales bacterium]HPP33205.1 NADH-quinone oxidoreductase subunit L [Ignavibacteriales bacterium]HRT99879.1 NADH-quinone oxidoreductase subunit L [Ignavibacteriales bacterium]